MTIRKLEFVNADNEQRKGFIDTFHSMMQALLAQSRDGDHFKVHLADGSVEDYKINDVRVVGNRDGMEVDVEPGHHKV